jgi:phosphotransferase system IIB component
MEHLQYIIIIAVLIIIAIAITKSKKKDFKIEINKLVEYLGGKDNIVSYDVQKSRFIVNLKTTDTVNKEGIQKMGAQGIVEVENQLKIIFGEDAKQLKKCIDDLM